MEDDLFSWQIENRERRIFLYPDAPGPRMAPADAIARCLLRECEKDGLVSADSADLSGYLVMLPGRQARHAVSQALSSLKKIIFPPEFTTSGRFRDMGCPTSLQPALPVEQKVLWINLLRDIDPLQFPALFPSGLETDLNSLFHQADLLLHLRQELNANADVNTFGSAANRLDGTDPRWAELKTQERHFQKRLADAGLGDPALLALDAVRETECFRGFRKIIAAASPDLPPAVKNRFTFLEEKRLTDDDIPEILIQVNAAECEQYLFDPWGCVNPEQWANVELPFQSLQNQIHSVEKPGDMAELAMRLAPDPETGVFDTARTAIVITDPGFFPDLSDAFSNLTQENGDRLPVYNPGGILLNRLQIVPLLNGLQSFLHGDAPSAECAGQLIRNESFLQFLSAKMNCPEDDVLAAADRYFQMRLPDVLTEENLSEPEAAYLKYLSEDDAKALKLFLRTMREILQRREQIKKTQHSIPAIRSMLTDVFCQSSYDDRLGIPFEDEAESVKGVLSDFETSPVLSILPAEETLYLLSETLSKRILYPEHAPDALEIIGFLELPFCSAERVILCGMNEGFLPEIIAPTPFLNDSIRTRLGLPNNATRYARDCFYLKDLLERTGGNIHFISVKTDEDGAPMRFSTLLFAPLNDFTELRKRAAVLFETYPDQPSGNDPGSLADAVPFHASIDLTGAFRQGNGIVLNVTDFKELLASPLRTYFNKKQKMAPVDYDKTELDASEQGSFLHQALQQFSVRPEWRTSVRTGSLPMIARTIEEAGTELCRLFAQNVEERLGKELPLLPQIQLERWEPMIRKTAKILLMKDRPVLEREWALNNGRGISFHGALIKGTLDRIEYDALSNTLYLIDFKTGASDSNPQKAHMVGGRFTNLQLPLYKMLLRQDRTFMERHPEIDLQTCRFICGYFWIYKKVDEIDYKIWENMEQYEPLAEETAKTVIDVVRRMSQNELQEDLQKHVKFDKYNELFLPEFSAVFQDGLALSEPPEYPRAPSGRGKKGGSK